MTHHHHPRGRVPRCAASRVGRLTPCSRPERTSDMNLRPIAAAAALTLCTATPADAHHVDPATVKARIFDVFGPVAGPHAIAIARCESEFDPHARHRNRNGTIDYGVFQLNSGGTLQSLGLTPATALDWGANIDAAHRLYRARGWKPWVCSRSRHTPSGE